MVSRVTVVMDEVPSLSVHNEVRKRVRVRVIGATAVVNRHEDDGQRCHDCQTLP